MRFNPVAIRALQSDSIESRVVIPISLVALSLDLDSCNIVPARAISPTAPRPVAIPKVLVALRYRSDPFGTLGIES